MREKAVPGGVAGPETAVSPALLTGKPGGIGENRPCLPSVAFVGTEGGLTGAGVTGVYRTIQSVFYARGGQAVPG
jgi:hypothetical protein